MGTGFPELKEWSRGWLRSIGELFHLARKRREAWEPGLPLAEQGAAFQALQGQLERAFERLLQRARQELECLAEHWESASGRLQALVEAQGRALHSLLVHEDGLGVFVEDPQVAPDSNAAERALRGPVIGRKTSFGSGSEDGAAMAALMYSVYGTLQLWGLNYYAWTLDYLNACARNGGQAPQDLSPWLPWEMDEARKAELSQPLPLAGPADSGKGERALPLAA